MTNKIFVFVSFMAIIASLILLVNSSYKAEVAREYMEIKKEWCYSQNGIMLEFHCFTKEMKYIEPLYGFIE